MPRPSLTSADRILPAWGISESTEIQNEYMNVCVTQGGA